MSAIAGVLARDGAPLADERLQQMLGALAYRGPDSVDAWCHGDIALGQLMLHTTPTSAFERLPLVARDGGLVLVGDLRLDNREELIDALGLGDRPTDTIPDGRIVLAAYERWGEGCAQRLLGDFAFAVWDARRRNVYAARDHFGVRPFYYYLSGRSFAFASAIKGLLTLDEVPRTIDEARVAEHLTSTLLDKTRTFYREVRRLPPAHTMLVSATSVRIERYYALDPTRELRLRSNAEYAEAVRAAFAEAVRCRLRTAGPIGTMLSGGLDSSAITCMARNILAQEGRPGLHSFSAVYDTVRESDERPYIDVVLAGGNIQPHYFHADSVGPLVDVERVLWHQDEALYSGNLYIHWCIYRLAAEQGIRVVLDGFDGDSTVSHGLGYFPELASQGRWLRLVHEVRAYSLRANKETWPAAVWRWYERYGLASTLARLPGLRALRRSRRPDVALGAAVPDRSGWARFLNPAFRECSGVDEARRRRPTSPTSEREQHFQLLDNAGESHVLELLNRTGAAHGIEVRLPFWDRRLVELCLSLPAEQKIGNGWTRLVMRRAMDGVLPEKIRWRGHKSDLGPGFDHGFIKFEQPAIERALLVEGDLIAPYIDIDAVRAAHRRYLAGQASEQETLVVWRAVALSLWLRQAEHHTLGPHRAAAQSRPA